VNVICYCDAVMLNFLKKKIRKHFVYCQEPYWFHKWDYGRIIESDNASAIEKYTCERCGHTKYIFLGR
jgi:hypothetical protein